MSPEELEMVRSKTRDRTKNCRNNMTEEEKSKLNEETRARMHQMRKSKKMNISGFMNGGQPMFIPNKSYFTYY